MMPDQVKVMKVDGVLTFWLGRFAGGQMSMAGPKSALSSMKNVRCMPSIAESTGGANTGLHGAPCWTPKVMRDSLPRDGLGLPDL